MTTTPGMPGTNPLNHARVIAGDTEAIDAKLPKACADALARAQRVTEAARKVHPGPGSLTRAVVDALDAGHDPATDPEVVRVVVASQVATSGLDKNVQAAVGEDVRDTFAAHADELVDAWRKPFGTAADTIARCHERIGDVPLDQTTVILAKGGDIARVWADAKAAVGTVGAVAKAWQALAQLARLPGTDRRHHVLRIAEADLAGLRRLDDPKADAWAVRLAGLRLSLADRAEYARRIKALEDEQAAAQTTVDRARSRIAGREIRVSS